ncbi:MAG: thioredoxin family protein [Firmicutes bacterium]|nr:thioredoxin family protein [Bacillota bacterium]
MKLLAACLIAAAPLMAQNVTWEHDLAAALKRAKAEKKLVFVDIWAEWCPPCQHLKTKVFPTAEAQKALAAYVPVALMTETKDRNVQPAAMAAAEKYRVEAYPTLLILDSDGKEVRRQTGAFRTGADLAAWLGKR